MFGVIKLAAPRQRQEIHSCAGEFGPEPGCVFRAVATFNGFVSQKTATDRIVSTDGLTDGSKDFEWQAGTMFTGSAITIATVILCRQKRCHCIGMGVMQFDAVKASLLCPQGSG